MMRDTSNTFARVNRIALRACFAAIVATGLGGCASGGGSSGAFAMASPGDSPTVTFDSIDGPPPQVFDRMVSVLDSETKMRNLAIVSRDGQAAYRVRSYLSAEVVHGKALIAWVWDVYDRDQQRAMRCPARSRPARPAATPGPRRMTWCCGRSRRRA